MQLSKNFTLEEFQKDEPIPAECYRIFTRLCVEILEPVRAHCGNIAASITSGYRDPQANAATHGQSNSEHMATKAMCAGDFEFLELPSQRSVFDWMRNNSSLPFHQLILEHGKNGSTIIHVSINELMPGVRSVKEGATHNSEPYVNVDHVAFVPAGSMVEAMGVDNATSI